jgi:hypothetical protein
MQIRRVLAIYVAVILAGSASQALAQKNSNDTKQPPKRSKAEQQEIDKLVGMVDGLVAKGQAPAADVPITWETHHYMRNADGSTIFPFIVSVDRSKLASPAVSIYVGVVDKSQPAAAASTPDAANKGKNDADRNDAAPAARPKYAFETVFFTNLAADGKFSRVIGLPPGNYELFLALKEKDSDDKKKAPAKAGLLRHDLVVPDLNTGLTTSDVIVASKIEDLPAPLTPQQQAENPYVIGPLRLIPTNDRRFAKNAELNVVFWVYGTTATAGGKPDVLLEYNFLQKLPEGEKFFNKTQPQPLNAETLPPNFDPAAGHQLTGIQSVSLMSFPAGDYRLEIKVTDKPSGKTITQNVNFTVSPS